MRNDGGTHPSTPADGPASVVILCDSTYYLALRSPAGRPGVLGVLGRHDLDDGRAVASSQLASFGQVDGGAWEVIAGTQAWRVALVATSLDAIAMLWLARAFIATITS